MSSMRCFSKKRTIADEEEESEGRIPLDPPTATPPPHVSNETINTVRNMADFGEILRTIGDFGLFQKLLLFALCFPNLILTFHLASVLFVQSDPVRRCNTDWILKADPSLTPEEQANLTLPQETDGTFSRCEMFVPVDWDIDAIRDYGLNETTECQNGWLYDKSMYEATIVTDFDLVCGKANLVQIAQTGLMAGILVGSLLFGPFAESFGRRRATQIPVVLMFVFTVTTGMCPNFYLYLLSQLMVGVGYGGFRVNCIVLATEWMGVTKRSFGSCVSQLFGAFGQCILAGIIYFIRDWRLAQWAIAAPLALVLIYIWFIPESARWLLDRGRTEEVKRLILRAAAINKCTVPESILEKLTEDKPVEKGGIRVLIRSPILRKNFLTISFAWFSLNLAYYCLSFNMANLGLDIFLTQLVFGLSEVPAHILCIWLLEALGRKLSLMGTMGIGGLACILLLTVPQDNAVAVTSLAVTGRFLMNWAGSICNVYVQELFPTSVRQTATGLGAIGTRIAGLLSPLLNLTAMFHWSIPTIVFGSLSLTSGALAFMLPETRNTELPDSTEEAEGTRTMKPMKRGSDLRMSDHNIISSCKL